MDPKDLLAKALHRTLFNAYKCGNKTVCKALDDMPQENRAKIVDNLFSDSAHRDAQTAQDPDFQSPAGGTSVLNKDQQNLGDRAKSEITSIKQTNADAALGILPKKKQQTQSLTIGTVSPIPAAAGAASGGAAAGGMAKDEPAKPENGLSKLKNFLAERKHSPKVKEFKQAIDAPRIHAFKKDVEAIRGNRGKLENFKHKVNQIRMKKSDDEQTWGQKDHTKGVHMPVVPKGSMSQAGSKTLSGHGMTLAKKPAAAEKRNQEAKMLHAKKLNEIRKMPKPDLGKSAANLKGVHSDLSSFGTGKPGTSGAGRNVRTGNPAQIAEAKGFHQSKLKEIKAMPKPNLGKSEAPVEKHKIAEELGRKAHREGRQPVPSRDKDMMGLLSGNKVGEGEKALKAFHHGWHSENLKKPSVAKGDTSASPPEPNAANAAAVQSGAMSGGPSVSQGISNIGSAVSGLFKSPKSK